MTVRDHDYQRSAAWLAYTAREKLVRRFRSNDEDLLNCLGISPDIVQEIHDAIRDRNLESEFQELRSKVGPAFRRASNIWNLGSPSKLVLTDIADGNRTLGAGGRTPIGITSYSIAAVWLAFTTRDDDVDFLSRPPGDVVRCQRIVELNFNEPSVDEVINAIRIGGLSKNLRRIRQVQPWGELGPPNQLFRSISPGPG